MSSATNAYRRPSFESIGAAVQEISSAFAGDRHERQRRRELDPADFARLAEAGFLLTAVPRERGGVFDSVERSVRPVAGLLRMLARGDASVALVASMHATVPLVCGWLSHDEPPPELAAGWRDQCAFVARSVLEGSWWGTLNSEPGSGGDVANTKTVAVPTGDGTWALTGSKQFGSGSGVMGYMMTTARPAGEDEPDVFFIDMRDLGWDGTGGMTLHAEWDGHGMTATQSHAFELDGVPATRVAWPHQVGRDPKRMDYVGAAFAAVFAGVIDAAMEAATPRMAARGDGLGALERVEWVRAGNEAWLIEQALEGMLRAAETDDGTGVLRGKTVLAELAESVMTRLCRVLGGGTYARHSPFGFWFEDVRALGFLRPPLPLAFASLAETGR